MKIKGNINAERSRTSILIKRCAAKLCVLHIAYSVYRVNVKRIFVVKLDKKNEIKLK